MLPTALAPESRSQSLESLVDELLRDKDFLLAQELKQRVAELNKLLKKANKQGLRLKLVATGDGSGEKSGRARLAIRIYKEI